MQEPRSEDERVAALDLFKAYVPELRGHLQFIDFLIRAVMADMERFALETDGGSRVFLRQLILMHLEHLESNSSRNSTTSEFIDAVRVWLSDDIAQAQQPSTSQEPNESTAAEFPSETINSAGGHF
jgi:hypothetical protein